MMGAERRGHGVRRLEVADESSGGMHHSLQQRQCRCCQPDKNCVAIVESRQDECRDEAGRHFLTEQNAKGTESSQVVVAGAAPAIRLM